VSTTKAVLLLAKRDELRKRHKAIKDKPEPFSPGMIIVAAAGLLFGALFAVSGAAGGQFGTLVLGLLAFVLGAGATVQTIRVGRRYNAECSANLALVNSELEHVERELAQLERAQESSNVAGPGSARQQRVP
jgi:hypothetical protein